MIRLTAISPSRRRASGEAALVEEARSGNREAFDRLVAEHEREIRNFIRRRVGRDPADDLLQDIWIAAWKSLGDYDGRSRFRTWVYGIAINKCRTYFRDRGRRAPMLALDEGIEPSAMVGAPLSDLEAILPSLMERLTDTHRQLLDLYYYGELTLPEISRMVDRNLNTVKYQFYRAHEEMAKLIQEGRK